jgi:glycosyltransferase involved in cell wall biosynthesis
VHYSYLSAITAGVVTKVFGGEVLYWNAGMPWLYTRPRREEWYQQLAFRLIDRLVTGAHALVPGYTRLYNLKASQVVVIPNWIDTTACVREASVRAAVFQEYSIPAEAKVLLFVHKLSKRKGAQVLPELMSYLKDPLIHLVIAGSGQLYRELEAAIKTKGLSDRVHLLGSVPRPVVKKLYQAADVFVMPSEEEGSPHSLIEAMAYHLPFAAFDVGGVAETATGALKNYVVPAGDVPALAHKITQLLKDPAEYTRVQTLEAEAIQRYQKPVVVAQFKALLTRVE